MTTDALQIKLLSECQENIPELAHLWYEEISKQWVPNSSVERATQNLIQHSNTDIMPMTFVAQQNGEAIGMASLRDNDGIRDDLSPWLGTLIVHPKHRQRKVGEALIETTKDQARKLGFDRLYLLAFNLTIPKWYARLGWEKIGMDTLFLHPVTVMQIEI